ncbi:NADP-dependent malic enzyme [Wolbachia endosymbiont of Pentidionis agamae]|uniref:NADP-dependent malic enzyme n=1 Tax=Wolbachia endosymbiont of Pentidionis agamae TaxID=3110435 RepID=UPI002FCEEEC2
MNNDPKKQEALEFHKRDGRPGKISILPTKPLLTQLDLSLAYSPGVAAPCLEIADNPNLVYDYTAKGNSVAVISNGTAVLGLGNIGPLASKPVMEGKAVLFKRFADIDAIDIEVDTEDIEDFINAVKHLGKSWGGINLEDIKSPDCFIIEKRLNELMDIPVFHDDQHGTAVIVAAGIINALDIVGKKIENVKIVMNGAGAAGIACLEIIKSMGAENIVLCDKQGVVYQDRKEDMNPWKKKYATSTLERSLSDAMKGADIFIGLSAKNVLNEAMLLSMNKNPIIFALANPDPEVKPEIAKAIRPDTIIATGRSDYANQVNNVMGFPYIFRGALDVRATTINDEMKIAAANAIAMLAREPVLDEVSTAYGGRRMNYGPEYIIPTPFDPRLISTVSPAVAKAAINSGVARKEIQTQEEWDKYSNHLRSRLSPTFDTLNLVYNNLRKNPKRIIFSEGEEEKAIRAAAEWCNNKYGQAILVGRSDKVKENMKELGIPDMKNIMIMNAAVSVEQNNKYIDYMYDKLKRRGYLYRSCIREVKTDRNVFASCMLACGDGDVLITGLTRSYSSSLNDIQKIISTDDILFGLSVVIAKNSILFIADTAVHESLMAEDLAKIAVESAKKAKQMGHKPRAAFISSSNFGSRKQNSAAKIYKAMEILEKSKVDFEYDGELSIDVALNHNMLSLYPFCKLTEPANILIMPDMHSASIALKLLQEVANSSIIGPILIGIKKSAQVVEMNASVSEILNLAVLASVYS